ncbi:dTDP-4-amino-4,6-dideoxygalactose transaminase [Vibrio cholerae]|uniref:dTDP-4-amino-4,6-dideoxygalactose transaminase n=1 Tax=Vibrio cholerae TaxID=666 RepID=UPI0006E6A827|nr:dTDP-4-amino-4,6-dideoxygalactose transaminase [Vibrio cholerae]EKY3318391.1 dTDP-4-amino-4,6-dideoxygalactose transaminase [Vibrio cholerae]KQA51607.1 TDP-4-oxo-6-deoxy-D-glucose aminotransferase [Vibrio cholerae]KQA63886.1 TDP-4-oxo-6-deoxy-D-glucose aminotransferase [Vibrio cholerae]KQA96431.1 TDP-4-oxo-6-deoxy-D-glucose aminotransferase [Vibrio cholerae]QKV04770.1 dTDP-4-amino-4,6-dideoxygalactose transaminase [Vibrio cholerae]
MNIKFSEPYITGKELDYIKDVFEQRHFYGAGKYTKKCSELIKNRISVNQVLITDSCTSALEISALLLRDFNIEQEIILPSYTFSSTASAFARAGYKIVFAEIDPLTMMLDFEDVKSKITEKTTAVVVVHYAGHCADVKLFRQLCDHHEIKLIEDAAQAFDSYLDGKALGTFGDFGCFSFHETKNIHAGLSGALIINDETYKERAVHIWERGTNRQEVLKGLVDKYSWVEIGGSFYPTELQAAFLFAQLESIDTNKNERKRIYLSYYNNLKELKESGLLSYPSFQDGYNSNYHAFILILNDEEHCDRVREFLVENGVSAYIGYVPLHSSKVGVSMGYTADSLPITEEMAKRVLRLPFHNNMTAQDASYISSLVKKSLE